MLGKIQKLYQQTKQNFLDSKTNSSITQYLNQEKQLDKIQKEAIAKAFSLPLTIISGSPGTGKTFVIARLLEAIQKNNNISKKIAFLTFTGKAASRLEESFNFFRFRKNRCSSLPIKQCFFKNIHYSLNAKQQT